MADAPAQTEHKRPEMAAHVNTLVQRLVIAAAITSLGMLLVGLFLAALGIFVLRISGGAAHDTSLVVLVAAYAVTDMWGACIVSTGSGAPDRAVTAAWVVMRATWLILLTLVMPGLWPVTLAMLLIALPLANVGARVGRHQRALRRAKR